MTVEDFTEYTVVDIDGDNVTVDSSTKIEFYGRNDEYDYVYYDKGEDYFGTEFTHSIYATRTGISGSSPRFRFYGIGAELTGTISFPSIYVFHRQRTTGVWGHLLYGYNDSGSRWINDSYDDECDEDTKYYYEITRDGTTVTVEIYDETGETLYDTLSGDLGSSETMRYIYAGVSYWNANGRGVYMDIESLDLGGGGGTEYSETLNETSTLSDTFERLNLWHKDITDNLNISDGLFKNVNKKLSESISFIDLSFRKTKKEILENLNITDFIFKNVNKDMIENIKVASDIFKSINRKMLEGLNVVDFVEKKHVTPTPPTPPTPTPSIGGGSARDYRKFKKVKVFSFAVENINILVEHDESFNINNIDKVYKIQNSVKTRNIKRFIDKKIYRNDVHGFKSLYESEIVTDISKPVFVGSKKKTVKTEDIKINIKNREKVENARCVIRSSHFKILKTAKINVDKYKLLNYENKVMKMLDILDIIDE